jgi:hypothetical protein
MPSASGTVVGPGRAVEDPEPTPEALIREARRRQCRRRIGVAVSVVALATGTAFAVWGGGDSHSTDHAAAGDGAGGLAAGRGSRAQGVQGRASATTRPPWFDLQAVQKWCRSASLPDLFRSGVGFPDGQGGYSTTVNTPDRSTGSIVRMPVRQYCAESAAAQPDPAGDLVGDFVVVDGHVRGEYFRAVTATHDGVTGEFQTAGPPVDPATAQQEINQQRARAVLICNRAKKLRMVSLPMCH